MPGVDVITYFKENSSFTRQITSYAANSIERSGIKTMDEFAGKSDAEVKRIRYMGEKCLKVAMTMHDKYKSENNINREEKNEQEQTIFKNHGVGTDPRHGADADAHHGERGERRHSCGGWH